MLICCIVLQPVNLPSGVVTDKFQVYISERNGHVIRGVEKGSWNIITVAGTPNAAGYSGDGGLATRAYLNKPSGMCKDTFGNIVFADTGNNVIRSINLGSMIIITVAGGGTDYGEGVSAVSALLSAPRYLHNLLVYLTVDFLHSTQLLTFFN